MAEARMKELAAIKRRISKIDPAFAPAIRNLAPCTFGIEKPSGTHYQSLVRAVIAQQVSTAAARTIGREMFGFNHSCEGRKTIAEAIAISGVNWSKGQNVR